MAHTLMRSYDRLADAEHARNALLGCGFAPSSVHIDSKQDEAGPAGGNGIPDTKDMGGGPGNRPEAPLSTEERTDAYNNSEPLWRNSILLTVEANDEHQRSLASDIMDRYDATNADRSGTGNGPA